MPVSWRVSRPAVTVQQLRELLVAPSRGVMAFPSEPYDEVYPGIVISDAATAFTLSLLRSLDVTHVLNAAHGTDNATYSGCYVNMHPVFYRSAGLGFMRVPAEDAEECNIGIHFSEAAEFIDTARRNGGKVLVHCVQGMSRSAALVIAYLMIKQGMPVTKALSTVRAKRAIFPNYGFLMQLIGLDEQLRAGCCPSPALDEQLRAGSCPSPAGREGKRRQLSPPAATATAVVTPTATDRSTRYL